MSFNFNTFFRAGSWKALRSFSLNQRKTIDSRINTINAELQRIGEVVVLYETSEDESGNITASEKRVGFYISSGTSLEKLMQAYIAQGGNPLDISMFLSPESVQYIRTGSGNSLKISTQPSDGIIYPESKDMSPGVANSAGFLSLLKYPARKSGGRYPSTADGMQGVNSRINYTKKWITQEINELRNDLEARIIKLCDLREQLLIERDSILPLALGNSSLAYNQPDSSRFSPSFSVANSVAAIDSLFFNPLSDDPDSYNLDDINYPSLSVFRTLSADDPDGQEDNTAL